MADKPKMKVKKPGVKATDLLRTQHREIEDRFRELYSCEPEERASLREELANALAAHSAIEEEIFYPAAMEALGPGGRIREAFEEHAIADFALYRFMHVSPSDESFAAKLGALKDVVMNHVEEEESELLPQAEGEIERDRLEMLGEKLAARFEERLMEGHASILKRTLARVGLNEADGLIIDVGLSQSQTEIKAACDEIKTMLLEKNRAYGDSALNPVRVFSKASTVEQINVRLDDKISRLMRGKAAGEDVELDLVGYIVLKRVLAKREARKAGGK